MPRHIILLAALVVAFFAAPSLAADVTLTGSGTCTATSVTALGCDVGVTVTGTPAAGARIFVGDGKNTRLKMNMTGTLNGDPFNFWYCPDATGPPSMPFDSTGCTSSGDFTYDAGFLLEKNAHRLFKKMLGDNFVLLDCEGGCGTATQFVIELTNDFEGVNVPGYKIVCDPQGRASFCNSDPSTDVIPFVVDTAAEAPTGDVELLLTDNFLQDTTALASIVVRPSGTLRTDGPVKIQLGPGTAQSVHKSTNDIGLLNQGTVDLKGDWYTTETGPVTYVDELDTDALFAVPEIVPCAVASGDDVVSNCATAANREFVALRWDRRIDADGNGSGANDPRIQELVDAIDARITGGDAVLMSFPDLSFGTAEDIPNDFWASLRVVEAGTTAGTPYSLWLKISLRSGSNDPAGFCFDRQDLQVGTVNTGGSVPDVIYDRVQTNETALHGAALCPASYTTEANTWTGRFIRFRNAADTAWECQGYPIGYIIDDAAGDIIVLAGDPDNDDIFRRRYNNGDAYVIDYGWKCGEPIAFQRPTVVTSATTATTGTGASDSWLFSQGHFRTSAVLFEGIGKFRWESPPSTVEFDYTTLHDPSWGTNDLGNVLWFAHVESADIGPGLSMYGGPTTVNPHHRHCFLVADSGVVSAHDSQIRHCGDDYFLTEVSGGSYTDETRLFHIKNVKAGWAAFLNQTQSQNFLDTEISSPGILVENVMTVGSVVRDGSGGSVFTGSGATRTGCTLRDVYSIGEPYGFGTGGCTANGSVFANSINETAGGQGNLTPGAYATNFVVRDVYSESNTNSTIRATQGLMRNGFFKRYAFLTQSQPPKVGEAMVDNVGFFDAGDFYDPATPISTGGALTLTGDCSSDADACNPNAVWKNITIANRTGGTNGVRQFVYMINYGGATTHQRGTFESIAMAQLDRGQVLIDASLSTNMALRFQSAAAWTDLLTDATGTWCFYSNYRSSDNTYRDVDPISFGNAISTRLTTNGGAFLRNIQPQWIDESRGQFLPVDGSPWREAGCGIRSGVGVKKRMLGHKLLDLKADYVGDRSIGSGGGTSTDQGHL